MTDASATLTVTTTSIANVFRFKNVSGNIHNSGSNIRFYVDPSFWPNFAISNDSSVSTGKLPISGRSTSTFAQDFIAYLSKKLFGTNDLVDLFNNESALLSNMINVGISSDTTSILSYLTYIGISGTHPNLRPTDGNGKYFLNSFTGADNLSRTIFNLIDDNDTNRLNIYNSPKNEYHSMPFISGDFLQFVMTIGAAPNQHLLTNVAPIAPRTYSVNLRLA